MDKLTDMPEDIVVAAEKAMRAVNDAPNPRLQLEAIARAILAERQRDQWQDIATAPKDGTLILVSFGEKGVRAVSWENPWGEERSDDNGIWCVDDDKHGPYPLRRYRDDDPTAATHWQPLPSPPKGS